ncbi:NAD(P)H-dependent oxidoreductase [Patescibacteria group bacterium]|nr:NAD(P)H-dependent oxidoreductase [Patescibacteria group bacterium]
MQKKKIFVLLGNPDSDSFSGTVATTYVDAAKAAGHEVERINIGDLAFDPILHKGYKEIQALEPDLVRVQEVWKWADHVVIIYPNWWCTMPALLKGMFDRMFLPGFAFNFDKQTKKIIQRLSGKSARVIVLAGTHSPFMTWWKFGDFTNEIAKGILGFAGMKTKVSSYGPCDKVDQECRAKWLKEVAQLGSEAV